MTETSTLPRIDSLIEPARVHSRLYTDREIFEEEMRRIWHRTWVYIGHESEVPNANDYVTKSIGPTPVLMVRDRQGEIRLLLNKCPHRGNQLCAYKQGNRATFTCPYHSWTFANTGELMGYALPDGYEGVSKAGVGLGKVARIGIYRGFVFGSMAAEGPTLMEHLGGAKAALDQLCDNSPTGELELTAGFLQHRTRANWKFMLENETDGYHPGFVHASIFQVTKSGIANLYGKDSTALTRDYGNGHTEFDLRPEWRRLDTPLKWFGTSEERLPEYTAAMKAAYGDDRARQIMIDGSPHTMIFPNLFIAEIQLFVLQPMAVDETIQHVTAVQFKGAPDINRRLRQQTMGSVGPAGLLLADDTEMYERNHRGALIHDPEWLVLSRGLHRERRDENGFRVAHSTDEVPQRGIWRHYLSLMQE
ncbi:aromatic ring-hydroxylating oxygenase subunit alpha [Pararhodobacter aggregans]|uniref:Ring-hydroxylating oxygenase subunit alpha n=1 Tax=Pararhodobacter aggregans TaxID=404875 RepID=A0A2T7UNH8_9RHOB|nr:aromatic ring-hydroxylating dioxygenase subunit alpha [Pararhodobacter aggregans]PTX00683.1 phenylpropionate dioxygenase-like ring-hydroxylating dioxygenase large terminal subunit [Pararhodobacter aggregans]PVE46224.1 ring-hydroxylating oxygenase subunit alpha [Pararhodobacter aggregans]